MLVNVHEAKTHFSRLLSRVESGEEIIIGRAGAPVARLIPYRPSRTSRSPGRWAGQVSTADDFDDTPQELIDAFEGNG